MIEQYFMKNFLGIVKEFLIIGFIVLVIVVPLRTLVFQPFLVRGSSMEPNYHNGDYLIVDELSYRLREPERGEVIVFQFPGNPSQRYIKRIVGLPGETIEIKDGKVVLYNEVGGRKAVVLDESPYLSSQTETTGSLKVTLKSNEYFVLGDNRLFSSDSRAWGVLPRDKIIGRVLIRVFPVSGLAYIQAPNYSY